MTAQTNLSSHRIYQFGLYIEKTVIIVVVLGVLVLGVTEYLQINIPNREFIFLLAGLIAIYTLIYHHFVYFKHPTTMVALIDSLVYSVFIFLLNHVTGGLHSPLFFLYLLPIISVRVNLGSSLPLVVTFFIVCLNILEFILQTYSNGIINLAGDNIQNFYSAATSIIAILLVGLYARFMSIELSIEHDELDEIQRLNSELKRIDRGKDEFISIASHEIRTPLTALRGGLELLMADGVGKLTEEQKSFVRKLVNSSTRLGEVAEDSLSISALERHRFTLKIEPFDVPELIKEVVTEESDLASEKKVSIVMEDPATSLPKAQADRKRIAAVLRNLISNAVKFTPSGGKVTVSIRSHGSKLICSVQDSGVGIPDEELANLFRKFYRVENVMSEQTHGTGLGLYIVKLIMNMHGETIGVESELGRGSTFTFTLKAVPHG